MNAEHKNAWQEVMNKVATWARVNSPWIIHFNSGSCNGCDIEVLATLTPRYDVERFGVKLMGSPRHADVLVATGPVTEQARERLKRVYEQMPDPKFVVAVGSCAITSGVFQGCYNVTGGIDKVIPVDAYIPGCPPRPEAIIDGIVKLLGSLQPPKGGAAPIAAEAAIAETMTPEEAVQAAEETPPAAAATKEGEAAL